MQGSKGYRTHKRGGGKGHPSLFSALHADSIRRILNLLRAHLSDRRGSSYIWLAGTRIPPHFVWFWPCGGFSWVALHAACLSLPFGALRGFRRCLSAEMPCGISAAAFAWLAVFFFVALTSSPCPGSSGGLRHLAGACEALARLCGGRASSR